jgi:hypothetical protein
MKLCAAQLQCIKSVARRNGPQGTQLWPPWVKHLAWSQREPPTLLALPTALQGRLPVQSLNRWQDLYLQRKLVYVKEKCSLREMTPLCLVGTWYPFSSAV